MDYRLLIPAWFSPIRRWRTSGLTEKEATRAEKHSVLAASYPFNDHGKSLIMEAKDGFVKLLADPKSGEILGGACVGPAGGELIHEIVAAMAKRMTVHELAADAALSSDARGNLDVSGGGTGGADSETAVNGARQTYLQAAD